KDYFLLFYQALHKNTQELSKILLRLFNLLQRNGRKSHRYEKKRSLIFWALFMSIPLQSIR
ncbi:IS4 family transposase, partial [Bacillus sp. Ab-1751]|nr:IS4 family transposase [Bacillus sp. Ab-1751]